MAIGRLTESFIPVRGRDFFFVILTTQKIAVFPPLLRLLFNDAFSCQHYIPSVIDE